ncbi:methylmalonyl-CoA mutase subunit beta, partial [Enterovirga sp.]|uniref:methylmalonyl-CoA mutase subunit beta n=1 Tax=Enterovirga sp. TaxID=2026350 RepID=UPI002619E929
MNDLTLASEFPPATREGWEAAVARVLKGADFEKRLVSRTADGLRIEPIYAKAEARHTGRPRPAAPWRVAARVDHPDPAEANALALLDVEGGADSLTVVTSGAATARGFGLRLSEVTALDAALAGIMLDMVALRLEAGPDAAQAASLVADLASRRGHDLADLDLDLGVDPIGTAARLGRWRLPWDEAASLLTRQLAELTGRGFRGKLVAVDSRPYHEAGATEAQELAAALSTGVAYLRAFEAGGQELAQARAGLSFTLVADADQFLTVAKVRALRRLWAQVETACGLQPEPIRLHVETAWRMTTRRDPWVNLLRGTMACFSAGIGGADIVTVLPFTAALGLPDGFARRLARNTQLVLLEESNLWRVADPVAGSGAFESLTDELAREAWARFGEIEREGGIVASLSAGQVQGRIAEARRRRDRAVATRREPITGTSEFPELREAPVAVLMPPPDAPVPHEDGAMTALPSRRLAEGYERLRDRSDALQGREGRRPRIVLAQLGPVAAHTARSTFARNAFEAVGIEALPVLAAPGG